MERRNIVATYVIRGTCIGFFFPSIAVLGCIYLLSPDDAQHTLGSLHRDFPLLWIIDSAPLVLGIISFIVGNSVRLANRAYYKQINLINVQTSQHLEVINNFATLIQLGKDVDDVVWSVAKNAIAELGYVDCVIYLIDEEQKLLIQRATHGQKNPEQRKILEPITIKVGEGIVGTVAATAKGEIVNDTSKDSRYILDDQPRLSEITVPMVHDGKVIGVIDSEHPEKNFYPPGHLTLLNTIASMTATKLVQIRYNADLHTYQTQLEKMVDEKTKEVHQLSTFPKHNPNPVIELSFSSELLFYNDAALKEFPELDLLGGEHPFCLFVKPQIKPLLENGLEDDMTLDLTLDLYGKTYTCKVYLLKDMEKARFYLNDVTEREKYTKIIETINKDLNASIRYAQHLQKAILPHPKTSKGPKLDSFVFYLPKDIVSGDFYAREDRDDSIIIAAADCTGHGVPGAMLSFVCFNALNSAIRELQTADPAIILNRVRELVIETFVKSEETVNDGMDIAMCTLNMKTKELTFAGANSPMYIVQKLDENRSKKDPANATHYLRQIKGDSQPIGNHFNMQPFNNNTLSISSGDIIYIFSDGFADQFGGKRDKKFGYRRFRKLLFSNYNLPMAEQKSLLQYNFAEWKGESDQIDDVLIIGIRL